MGNQYRRQVPDGEFRERQIRDVGGIRFGFEWHGGEYIEVYALPDAADTDLDEIWPTPGEVINVWDHREDGPRIPRTTKGFTAAIDEWIEEYDDLVHDASENWNPT